MRYLLSEDQFIENYRNTDFVLKTQTQIAKDFERLGYAAHPALLSHQMSLDELQYKVAEMLGKVIQLGETQTLQLLYIIDIPQSVFLEISSKPNFLTEASHLIIRREAQKVYLRSLF
jgi:hypothetical protein